MTFSSSRTFVRPLFRLGGIALATLLLGACISDQGVTHRGFVLDDKALDQIRPGSSAEQVVLVLGTPSTTSTVGSQTYYLKMFTT